ncbi:MAG TPA: hypothetical protein ENG01_01480 [Candidatus Aenigmarchaeota archaeon]|nr:MAG: hypothetical protein DRN75_01895 [Nanoarchaeota archaeon]HDO80016.1 hypothetical protein [Candidatus Aenigmarchaeota archaeon]HEX33068.1 hypothetical protein [Candidatus Aenigmarchaeota archaeon]
MLALTDENVQTIAELTNTNDLLAIKPVVLRLYSELESRGALLPREKQANLASLVYIAARKKGLPILLEDLEYVFGVNRKRIFRFLKRNIRALRIHLPPEDPLPFLDRYAKEFNLTPKEYRKVKSLLLKIPLSGKSVKAMVISTIVYVKNLDAIKIAKEYRVSPYTIKIYRDLLKSL